MLPSHSQNTAAIDTKHRAGSTINNSNGNVFNKQSDKAREQNRIIPLLILPYYHNGLITRKQTKGTASVTHCNHTTTIAGYL